MRRLAADPARHASMTRAMGRAVPSWKAPARLDESAPAAKDAAPSSADVAPDRSGSMLSAPAVVPEELLPQLQSGAYARVRIADNGKGVPRSLKDSIFSPFFSTRANGSGFGLSMIRSVVEGHGGAIREVGREKRGATFEMFLPLAELGQSGGDEVGDNPAGG